MQHQIYIYIYNVCIYIQYVYIILYIYTYTCVEDVCPVTPLCGANPIHRPGPVVFASRDQGRPCAFLQLAYSSHSTFFFPNENHPRQVGVKHGKTSQGYKQPAIFRATSAHCLWNSGIPKWSQSLLRCSVSLSGALILWGDGMWGNWWGDYLG